MRWNKAIFPAFIVFAVILITFSPASPPVSAQALCPGPGTLVKVFDSAKLNVRPSPGGSIPNNAPDEEVVGSPTSPKYFVYEEKTISGISYLRIENGDKDGWILSAFLELTCGTLVPPATPTRTSTVSPRSPTPAKTPTRLPSSTPGPSPTEIPILLTAIAGEDEWVVFPFVCPKACEGYIIVRNLP